MYKNKKCIGIMSIGSGVGQSVIASLRLSQIDFFSIGMGNNPLAFGSFECDESIIIPSIFDSQYLTVLLENIEKFNIDLLIPGSDNEALLLAKHKDVIEKHNTLIIVADYSFISKIRDKRNLHAMYPLISHLFVKSYTKEELVKNSKLFPVIAKPLDGFASKNIRIIQKISDLDGCGEQFVFQEIAYPHSQDTNYEAYLKSINKGFNLQISEISIQYIISKDYQILGKMMTYNKLNNGVPIEITPIDEFEIWAQCEALIKILIDEKVVGPINIQGRLTDFGFKIFELNARFTGISGLRALMGFNEVEASVINFLEMKTHSNLNVCLSKVGVRQTTDKVISLNQTHKQKIILITGISGYLGQALENVYRDDPIEIWGLTRNEDALKNHDNVKYFSYHDLFSGKVDLSLVNSVIHCAFARPHLGDEEIFSSLNLSFQLFNLFEKFQVPKIINISTQSVYGTSKVSDEKCDIELMTLYEHAKYQTEKFLEAVHERVKHIHVSSLRLGTLMGGTSGLVDVDLISKLVEQALINKEINIKIDSSSIFNRLDVRDGARAIKLFEKSSSQDWENIYNLGSKKSFTLSELLKNIQIQIKTNIRINYIDFQEYKTPVMDSNRFYDKTKFVEKYHLESTILSLLDFFTKKNRNDI